MRAAFAGYVFELVGCDAMHNADKFTRFATSCTTVDCRIEVTVQKDRLQPHGERFEQVSNWRRYPHGKYTRIYHRNAMLMIEATDDFSEVRLTFCDNMPELETKWYLQVQQMIGNFLLLHGRSLIHSAGLSLNGSGVLLCGRSGVGKSTMAARLQQLDKTLAVLSEDMPAILREDDCLTVGGTPLCGDDEQCENSRAPLSGIVFLRQATQNRPVTLTYAEAVYELLTVLPRAVYAPAVTEAATDWSITLAKEVPIAVFENDGTEQAAQMLLQYITNRGNQYED